MNCSLTKHHLNFSQILVSTRPAIRTKLQFQVSGALEARSATQNPLQYSWHIMTDPQASTSTSTLGQAMRASNAKINATLAMVDADVANFLLRG